MSISRESSCAIVRNAEGKILVVWNDRLHGYTLPGGKQEPGETAEETMIRELYEETGVVCIKHRFVVCGQHRTADGVFNVSVYEADVVGEAREAEPGCPVAWVTKSELYEESPFGKFYETMFPAAVGSAAPAPAARSLFGIAATHDGRYWRWRSGNFEASVYAPGAENYQPAASQGYRWHWHIVSAKGVGKGVTLEDAIIAIELSVLNRRDRYDTVLRTIRDLTRPRIVK